MLAALAAAVAPTSGLPVPADLTAAGVLVSVIVGLGRLWWIERRDRVEAQAAVLALTERVVATTTEQTAALDRYVEATRALADEVRRLGDRR